MHTRTIPLSADSSAHFDDATTRLLHLMPENTADTFVDGEGSWTDAATVFEVENAVPTLASPSPFSDVSPQPMIGESEADEAQCAARNAYTAHVIAPAWFRMMGLLIRAGLSPIEASAHCECMFED